MFKRSKQRKISTFAAATLMFIKGVRVSTEYIHCSLSTGFFEDEFYIVVGESSAIVSKSDVEVVREPLGQRDGEGRVRAYVIERYADRMLVELPGQPVVGGLRTWIMQEESMSAA